MSALYDGTKGLVVRTIPAEIAVPVSVERNLQPLFGHLTPTPGAQIIAALWRFCDHKA